MAKEKKNHSLDLTYPNGNLKAKFVRYLRNGECPRKVQKEPNVFTDGNKVYRKII